MAVTSAVPFSANVRVGPVTVRVKLVPAARALTGCGAGLGPGPVVAQEQHQFGAAVVGVVDADIDVRPPAWARTAGPTHWVPVSWVEVSWTWDYWSLEWVSAVRVSPESPLELVPGTCWLTIARPPSAMSVQLGPRLPLARAKLYDFRHLSRNRPRGW